MTRFAHPDLHQCPACAGYFQRDVLVSFHYYDDMPEWSDGMTGQWWAGASAPVGRCPACCRVVWIDDAIAVMQAPMEPGKIGPIGRLWHRMTGDKRGRLRDERKWALLPTGIKQAKSIDRLECADDFIEALAALPAADDNGREVYMRRRLWWASSDHQRVRVDGLLATSSPAGAAAPARANRLRLLELIEHDPNAQVERGELLRQLGRFDEAVAVLKAVKPDGYSEVKAVKIELLAAAGIAELRDLKSSVLRSSSVDGANHAQSEGTQSGGKRCAPTTSADSTNARNSPKRLYAGERADDYIVPSFLLPESRGVSEAGQAGHHKDTPNWRVRYILPDHTRTRRGRLKQAIVDWLHRRGD